MHPTPKVVDWDYFYIYYVSKEKIDLCKHYSRLQGFSWNIPGIYLGVKASKGQNHRAQYWFLIKDGCNRGHGLSAAIKLGTPEPKFSQTDLQPVKQNFCLAPDQNMVRPQKVANDLKINLAPLKKY